MNKIISMEETKKELKNNIDEILKDASYSEIENILKELPMENASEEELYYFGVSYINEYYKLVGRIEKTDNSNNEELKHTLYECYLIEKTFGTVFSEHEFILFGRLMNIAFTDYNHKKIRKNEKVHYECCDKSINHIVDKIIKECNHSSRPHAYEIPKFKFEILINSLKERKNVILKKEIKRLNFNELNDLLSEDRIKNIDKKKKYIK